MKPITYDMLVKLNACNSHLRLFKRYFKNGVVPTIKLARSINYTRGYITNLDINWFLEKAGGFSVVKEYFELIDIYGAKAHKQIRKRLNKLEDDFSQGKITESQYNRQYNKIYKPYIDDYNHNRIRFEAFARIYRKHYKLIQKNLEKL